MENNKETKELENVNVSNENEKNDVEQVVADAKETTETSPFAKPETDTAVAEEVKEEVSPFSQASVENANETTTDFSSDFQGNDISGKKDNKREASGNYHLTLLLSYFLGVFGAHRFVNGKKKSGLLMLLLTLFFPTIYIAVMLLTGVNMFNGEGGLAFIILIILTPFVLVAPLMAVFDFICIITGNFKNKTTGEKVKSGKPFFKTWSNILVIVLLVISLISGGVTAMFTTDLDVVEKGGDKDKDGDDEGKGKDKENKGDASEYLELIGKCVTGDDFTIDEDDRDNFEDTLEDYFDEKGYLTSIDNKSGYLSFDTDADYDSEEVEYSLTIFFDVEDGDMEVRACDFELTQTSYDDDFNSTRYTIGQSTYNYGDYLDVTYSSSENDDERISILGEYDLGDDEYDLEMYKDYDYDTKEVYDIEKDQYDIMDTLDEYISTYLDEYEELFE